MKIQRKPLKNKTFNNLSSQKFNPKFIEHFVSTYLRDTNIILKNNKSLTKRKKDNNKLNFIYMALNKPLKFNNNNNFNNINTSNNNNITKRKNNKGSFLQNIFLANSLNIDKNKLKSSNTNINIKKINMNKYFSEYYNKNRAKSSDDKKYEKIKNPKYNSCNWADKQKIYKNIYRLMRIKSNMKYIKQNPYFKDLNLQPSSDKSLFFLNGKINPKTSLNSKNMKSIPKIPKLNIIKNIKNFSTIAYNLKNNNQFEENKNKNLYIYNSHNYNYNYNPHKQLSNIGIKKGEKIIFSYNYIYNKNSNDKDKIQINNKNSKLIKSGYVQNSNDKKYILKNNIGENYRLNSSKKSNNNRRIIYNNFLNNKNENNKNIDMNVLNEDLIYSNMSFSDSLNESNSFIGLNPVYS